MNAKYLTFPIISCIIISLLYSSNSNILDFSWSEFLWNSFLMNSVHQKWHCFCVKLGLSSSNWLKISAGLWLSLSLIKFLISCVTLIFSGLSWIKSWRSWIKAVFELISISILSIPLQLNLLMGFLSRCFDISSIFLDFLIKLEFCEHL